MKFFSGISSSLGLVGNRFLKLFSDRIEFSDEDLNKLSETDENISYIYVLRAENALDYFVLKCVLEKAGIDFPSVVVPQISSVLGSNKTLTLIQKLIFGADFTETVVFKDVISGHNAVVALFSPGTIFHPKDTPAANKFLYNLVCTLKTEKTDRRFIAVPVVPIWQRHSVRQQSSHQSVVEKILGTPEHYGIIKTTLMSLFSGFRPVVKIGKPVHISDYLSTHSHLTCRAVSKNIRFLMEKHIESEFRLFLGPLMESFEGIKRTLSHNKNIINEFLDAVDNGEKSQDVIKELNKSINEIPSSPSTAILTFHKHILSFTWNLIYKGFEIDDEGFSRMRQAAEKGPLLIIPSHRSHIDYLVLSWFMDKYHMPIPHIAAGKNLSFWPMGTLFRGGGAFFIRRTFKGNKLYKTVLTEYLAMLFNKGINVEFFIEGTRSRSGKIVYPKTGMLSIISGLVQSGAIPSPMIVPVSIGYEKVLEDNSYNDEDSGKPKQKENFSLILKNFSVLLNKYGRANIRIGEPFSLADELNSSSQLEFEDRVNQVAFRTASEIVQNTLVTSSMVFAAAILGPETQFTENQLFKRYVLLRDFAVESGAKISKTLQNKDTLYKYFLRSLKGFSRYINTDNLIMVNPHHRKNLVYYKNGYIQVVIKPALAIFSRSFGVGASIMHEYIWNQLVREFANLNFHNSDFSQDKYPDLSEKYKSYEAIFGWFFIHIISGQLYLLEKLVETRGNEVVIKEFISEILKSQPMKNSLYLPESSSMTTFRDTISLFQSQGILPEEAKFSCTDECISKLNMEIKARQEIIQHIQQLQILQSND
ncbi:MAG: 1-acyl-sn-glycerol-3-phosphate acyltransferase [Deltaproteobacteria bacterium]|nr:1-acyl-sn-glycerol-3-phosphate acyltransferase [Deltaproteobacteria bacterium]